MASNASVRRTGKSSRTTKTGKTRTDIHDAVTQRIIAMLENADKSGGELPWCRPGVAHSRPTNVATKQRYRGINVLSLWGAADVANYRTGLWGTFRQWQELGAHVRKGETATPIVFYKPIGVAADAAPDRRQKHDAAEAGDASKTIRMLKDYWGFNADQVDGYELPAMPTDTLVERDARLERFFAALRIPIAHGGTRAFYRPSEDRIQMPELALFRPTATSSATEGYYAVLAHECGHATGASHRLDRNLTGRFGDESYAVEELIAELTSAFLCADLAITAQPRPDHAHYIKNWLTVLKGDNTAVFTAAAAANRAAEFLHGLQPH